MADMEEDKVADMVANPPKKSTLTSKLTWKSNLVRVGHGGCLIGHKLRPKAYLACASSKLCEFILVQVEDKLAAL